jgi:L-ascorbate metabolism protein UlaG (beta-lactamase superfamily)
VHAVGYVVDAGARVWFAGDTDLFPELADLAGVDVALVPISGWGPPIGRGHLDPERAAEALATIRPRFAVPIHWGTYRMFGHGGRPADIDVFRDRAAALAPDVELHVLPVGASLEL